jgi:hypothetical protein
VRDACVDGKNRWDVGALIATRQGSRKNLMWRETIETGNFARCHFCSEIIVAERTSSPMLECDWHRQGGMPARPSNDNSFHAVIPMRKPVRRITRSRRVA